MPWSLKKNHRPFCSKPAPNTTSHTTTSSRRCALNWDTRTHRPCGRKTSRPIVPVREGSSEDVEVGEALLASDIVGYLDGVNKTWAHNIIRDDTSRSGPLSVTFRQDSLVGIQAQISGRKGRSSGEDASQGWGQVHLSGGAGTVVGGAAGGGPGLRTLSILSSIFSFHTTYVTHPNRGLHLFISLAQ